MKRKAISVVMVCIYLLFILGMGGCGQKDTGGDIEDPAVEPIKIGALFPRTGNLALEGTQSFEGAELATIEINAKGGLLGRPVELVIGDAVDTQQAVAEAERLISMHNVDIIIGTFSSALSYVASEVAERNGVIYWEQGAVATNLTQRGFKYFFRVCPSSLYYGKAAGDFIREVGADLLGKPVSEVKVAMAYEDGLFGMTSAEGMKIAAADNGFQIVADEPYKAGSTDLSSLIMRLKDLNPDILYNPGYLTDQVTLFDQSSELGFKLSGFVGTGGTALKEFVDAVGIDRVEGAMQASFAGFINPTAAPGIDNVMDMYKKQYGKDMPSPYPLVNYVGTSLLFEVIELAGTTDPDAVREAALKVKKPSYSMATGWGVNFAPAGHDHAGQNLEVFCVLDQYQDGKLVPIFPQEVMFPGTKIVFPLPAWQ